ncbi:proteasome subunit beta [Candidatus Bathyarchaeota archaeon]|nr:proteasome subunit beta [Candidatus Bathyarchaeota archaeon]
MIVNQQEKVKTGTTTVGIITKDAVILGADKRATMGAFVASKTAKKIHKIDDHAAATIAGGVADAQYLMDYLSTQSRLYSLRNGRKMSIRALSKTLSNKLYSAKRQGPRAIYQVHHLLGGIDEKGPHLFDIGGYGSILEEKFSSTGSGSVFAYGVLEDGYSGDLDIKAGIDLVKRAVNAAISRDIASGNGIDLVIITRDGFERKHSTPVA